MNKLVRFSPLWAQSINKLFLVSFVSFVSLISCSKNEDLNTIPWARVNFEVDVKSKDTELAGASQYKVFTNARLAGEYVGYAGLLVVTSTSQVGSSGYYGLYAFDLCCPYEKRKDATVSHQSDGTAKCNQCGSVFTVTNGGGKVKSGPAKEGLKIYPTKLEDATNGKFRIYN